MGTALADDTYTVTATASDAAGNSSTGFGTLVVDTTAPTAPTLNLAAASDSGTVGDLRTDDSSVELPDRHRRSTSATVTLFDVRPCPAHPAPVRSSTRNDRRGRWRFVHPSTNQLPLASVPPALPPVSPATDAAGNARASHVRADASSSPATLRPAGRQPHRRPDFRGVTAGGAETTSTSPMRVCRRRARSSAWPVTYPDSN